MNVICPSCGSKQFTVNAVNQNVEMMFTLKCFNCGCQTNGGINWTGGWDLVDPAREDEK